MSAYDSPVSRAKQAPALVDPPIFIVGHARCGTTWLFDIVTSHPAVAGVFESWMFTYSNGFSPLLRAHFGDGLLATKEKIIGRRSGLSQMITRGEAFEAVRSLSLDWLGRSLGPGQRFVVEKGPMDYDLVHELFPDARYVHILRDGRDATVSVMAASRSWAPEIIPHIGNSVSAAARLWRDEVGAIRELAGWAGERFYEVRYEELRREPRPIARRVFDFLGIPTSDEQIEQIVLATAIERQSDLARRSGFVRKGGIGGWRDQMDLVDRLRFQRAAGDVLRATGYASSRWWWLPGAG